MALLEAAGLHPDRFATLADDAPLTGPAIVSLARLGADPALPGPHPLGAALPNDADPAVLRPWLDRLAVVVLHWPKHRDGRGFSQARALRERLGYGGAIRATGHLLPDQCALLRRCGVTSVALPEGADPEEWLAALRRLPLAYQAAAVGDAVPRGLLRRQVAIG